jgi:NADH:ubiquinone oxidoreductase subunit F (NADH-binding)
MLATICGAVAGPGVYEIELGTPVADALALAGMSAQAGAVLVGGYFGTWHDMSAVAGLTLASPALPQGGVAPGAGVLAVLPAGACGLAETARVLGYLAAQSAGQCGPCVFGLAAIADDFAQLASGRPRGPVLERLDRRLGVVSGRGACRHPDGATRLAASALAAFAADARAHAQRRPCQLARHGRPAAPVLPVPRPESDGRWR